MSCKHHCVRQFHRACVNVRYVYAYVYVRHCICAGLWRVVSCLVVLAYGVGVACDV